jgi:hypothetical protein
MTVILNEPPYHDTFSEVSVDRQVVQVLPHQIIVWVSPSLRSVLALSAPPRRFPAVLDTGNSYGFAISEKHLEAWAGLSNIYFPAPAWAIPCRFFVCTPSRSL